MSRPRRDDRTGVLFVCLGNICRSPLAEAVFVHLARHRGVADRFDVDSCGTGAWHVGEPADRRTIAVARRHGVEMTSIARQLACPADAERWHYVIAMDRANRRDVVREGVPAERVRLLRSFDPEAGDDLDVPDPYSWPADGFDRVYAIIERGCRGLLDYLVDRAR